MASNIANLGGYDCDFIEPPPDSLLCLICTFVAKEPMQMDCCGKVYCTACLKVQKKYSNKCPQCREEGNGFNDRRSERDIKALKVKCDNLKNGCEWTGELATLHQHLEACGHALLSCPNKCKETVQVLRKDLKTHLNEECPNRSCQCPHCQEEGKHCDITTSHLETCPQLVILCPNERCGEELPRCDISNHRKMCPFEAVTCKYSRIGCEEKPLRKELEHHEEDDHLHLHLAMETILGIGDIEHRLTPFRTADSNTTFKMCKFSHNKESEEEFYGPPFYTHQGGYRMRMRVDANGACVGKGTHVSVFAKLMTGENDDNLTWPFIGTVTVELLNQLEDKNHHQSIITFQESNDYNRRVVNGENSDGWGYSEFISHKDLNHNHATNCQYLKDDCLYFRVSVKATPNPKPWLTCTV